MRVVGSRNGMTHRALARRRRGHRRDKVARPKLHIRTIQPSGPEIRTAGTSVDVRGRAGAERQPAQTAEAGGRRAVKATQGCVRSCMVVRDCANCAPLGTVHYDGVHDMFTPRRLNTTINVQLAERFDRETEGGRLPAAVRRRGEGGRFGGPANPAATPRLPARRAPADTG